MPTEQNKILDGLKQQLQGASQTLAAKSVPTISADALVNPNAALQVPPFNPPAPVPFAPALSQPLQDAKTAAQKSEAEVGALYDKLGTQEQRRQQLETTQGIPTINTRLSELNALDAQYAADLQNIQADELKQNITGDLATNYAPVRNAISGQNTRLNMQKQQNTIMKRATNGAAMAAAQGQLSVAQEYVQRALDAEFEPIKYLLQYKKDALQRDRETLDAAEQRQYDAQLKAEERSFAEAKQNKEQILSYVQRAAQNQAPADIIQEALAAPTPEKSLAILAPFFKDPNADLERQLMQQQLISARNNGAGAGLSTSQYFQFSNAIADDVRNDPDVKDFISVRDGFERVKAGAGLNNAQGDLSLLFGYMKLLDPNSVVRETEFDNAQAAMGYAQRVLNLPAQYFKGERLTPYAREEFSKAANALYAAKEKNYQNAVSYYQSRAQTFGIPPELVLRDYGTQIQQPNQPQSPVQPYSDTELENITFADSSSSAPGPFSAIKSFFGL